MYIYKTQQTYLDVKRLTISEMKSCHNERGHLPCMSRISERVNEMVSALVQSHTDPVGSSKGEVVQMQNCTSAHPHHPCQLRACQASCARSGWSLWSRHARCPLCPCLLRPTPSRSPQRGAHDLIDAVIPSALGRLRGFQFLDLRAGEEI